MARLEIQTKATDKTKNTIIPAKRGDDNHQGKQDKDDLVRIQAENQDPQEMGKEEDQDQQKILL